MLFLCILFYVFVVCLSFGFGYGAGMLLLLRVGDAWVQLTRLTVLLPTLTSMDWIQLVAVVVAVADNSAELSIIIRMTTSNKSLVWWIRLDTVRIGGWHLHRHPAHQKALTSRAHHRPFQPKRWPVSTLGLIKAVRLCLLAWLLFYFFTYSP